MDTKDFNPREWARKQAKKLCKSIAAGLKSPVASERIASRDLLYRMADVDSMEQPEQEEIQFKRAEPLKLVNAKSEAS
jgi:hypothetical protein